MRIKLLLLLVLFPAISAAGEHGPSLFHAFRLEADLGNSHGDALTRWDLDGWIGGDTDKLWLKSEGELTHHGTETAEFWGMYSHSISDFWDAQIGLRQDIEPETTTYLTAGFDGLAPYYFETEAHIFLSDHSDVSARVKLRNDLLITQRLVAQPYLEVNVAMQNTPELDTGRGITNGEIGLQTRYEFTREFAPYIDMRYESKFGNTAHLAEQAGENRDGFIAAAGLRLMF